MKKLLLGSVFLTFFAISITLFQASCQKEAIANTESTYTLPPATSTTLGGVIIGSGLDVTANGTLSVTSGSVAQQNKIIYIKRTDIPSINGRIVTYGIWTANYDGSNQQELKIALPPGFLKDFSISQDRQTLFISLRPLTGSSDDLYSCKIDGSNLKKIIDSSDADYIDIYSLESY